MNAVRVHALVHVLQCSDVENGSSANNVSTELFAVENKSDSSIFA